MNARNLTRRVLGSGGGGRGPSRLRLAESATERRQQLSALARRSREVLLLAALVGAVTGLAVVAFDKLVHQGLDRVLELPVWLAALTPMAGLAVAGLSLRYLGAGTSPSTADEYIKTYHDRKGLVPLRPLPGKVMASLATLASGGALGLEGPSIYLGSVVGSTATGRLRRFLTGSHAKVLITAGAAAGVAAIFKAPATGAIFALEVPYRDDLGRRLLLPACVGAASGYLAFAAFEGTSRLFPVGGNPAFDFPDLGGSLALGVAAGLVCRLIARSVRAAKETALQRPLPTRVLAGGLSLAGFAWLSYLLTGEVLTLGPGYEAMAWAADTDRTVIALTALLVLRCAATASTLAAGGAGGIFIPLVVAGHLLGRITGELLPNANPQLFTVVGIAAALGGGYRVPLAALMFVAETTGRPGFIVPGLLAAVAADLVMGSSSVTPYQKEPGSVPAPAKAPAAAARPAHPAVGRPPAPAAEPVRVPDAPDPTRPVSEPAG